MNLLCGVILELPGLFAEGRFKAKMGRTGRYTAGTAFQEMVF
jgi:hypothetical protein